MDTQLTVRQGDVEKFIFTKFEVELGVEIIVETVLKHQIMKHNLYTIM